MAFPSGTSAFHINARNFANTNMLVPGSPEFEAAVNAATNGAILTLTDQGAVNIDGTPRLSLGARIIDVSTVSTFEANYDFEDKIDFANLIVGGLVRSFNLDTEGTLYTDYDEAIEFNEFGVYANSREYKELDLIEDLGEEVDPDIYHYHNTIEISPSEYAEQAKIWVDEGAYVIGGCCDTGPNHIRALVEMIS